jgi:hypothetical protein
MIYSLEYNTDHHYYELHYHILEHAVEDMAVRQQDQRNKNFTLHAKEEITNRLMFSFSVTEINALLKKHSNGEKIDQTNIRTPIT